MKNQAIFFKEQKREVGLAAGSLATGLVLVTASGIKNTSGTPLAGNNQTIVKGLGIAAIAAGLGISVLLTKRAYQLATTANETHTALTDQNQSKTTYDSVDSGKEMQEIKPVVQEIIGQTPQDLAPINTKVREVNADDDVKENHTQASGSDYGNALRSVAR